MTIRKLMDFSAQATSEQGLPSAFEKAAEERKQGFAEELEEFFNRGVYDSTCISVLPPGRPKYASRSSLP
jgi:hypothetical protein